MRLLLLGQDWAMQGCHSFDVANCLRNCCSSCSSRLFLFRHGLAACGAPALVQRRASHVASATWVESGCSAAYGATA